MKLLLFYFKMKLRFTEEYYYTFIVLKYPGWRGMHTNKEIKYRLEMLLPLRAFVRALKLITK